MLLASTTSKCFHNFTGNGEGDGANVIAKQHKVKEEAKEDCTRDELVYLN
jgi:hypothetical protein